MTKKDYIKIAEVFRKFVNDDAKKEYVEVFSKIFAEDNPRFNRAKFLEACGAKP